MRFIWLAATTAMLGLATNAAVAQQVPPPILPGEIYVETAGGCGVAITPAELKNGATVASTKEFYAKNVWYGRCVDGLVDGDGQFAGPGGRITLSRNQHILGRDVTLSKSHDAEKQLTTYRSGDQWAEIYDGPKPFGPRWGQLEPTLYAPGMKSSIGGRRDRCMESMDVAKKAKKFGCSYSNNYRAYTFWVVANDNIRTVVCPDPRTPEGCDKLWMAEGEPVFDSIQAFIAPIETELAARRTRYQALVTPAWRAQAEANQKAVLADGTAGQLRDLVAGAIVTGDLPEALRLHELLSKRYPSSPAIAQSQLHLTTLYCLRSAPTPVLRAQEAAEVTRIFQSEPCRRAGVAEPLLFSSKIVLDSTKQIAGYDAESDARVADYFAQQRRERDAYWGSMLGVITGVIANTVTPRAPSPTYSGGGGTVSPAYVPPSSPSAFPGQSYSANSESVAHNPANEARSCITPIYKPSFAANRVSSNMGAVFRNGCGFSVEVTWCATGADCNPGYSNLGTVLAKSDRGISFDATRPGSINYAACRIGFTRAQGELSRTMQHACK